MAERGVNHAKRGATPLFAASARILQPRCHRDKAQDSRTFPAIAGRLAIMLLHSPTASVEAMKAH